MADFLTGANQLGTLLTGIGGYRLTQQGAQASAQSLQLAASSSRHAANFNASIARLNSARSILAQTRQTERNLATYRATAAGRGFSQTSKTFMAFANEELSNFERAVQQQRTSVNRSIAVAQYEAESQARIQEAQAARIQASARQRAAMSVPNLLGQVAGLASTLGGFS